MRKRNEIFILSIVLNEHILNFIFESLEHFLFNLLFGIDITCVFESTCELILSLFVDFEDSFLLTTFPNEEMREWVLLVLTGIGLHNELSVGFWVSWSVLKLLSRGLGFAKVVLD